MSSDEWKYERGEGRFKHRWKNDFAGFEPGRRGPIGKCPCHVTKDLAQTLLNDDGIPLYESEDSEFPDRIYAVYRGAIYEAVPTQPGISYHAYPWRGDLPGRVNLPRRILRELRNKANMRGEEKDFMRWLKKYGGPGQ